MLTVNVSIFTTFSVRKRLSNVKLLRQIYQGEQIYSKRSLCHSQESIELVLNVMQIPNLLPSKNDQSRVNEKNYALSDT